MTDQTTQAAAGSDEAVRRAVVEDYTATWRAQNRLANFGIVLCIVGVVLASSASWTVLFWLFEAVLIVGPILYTPAGLLGRRVVERRVQRAKAHEPVGG